MRLLHPTKSDHLPPTQIPASNQVLLMAMRQLGMGGDPSACRLRRGTAIAGLRRRLGAAIGLRPRPGGGRGGRAAAPALLVPAEVDAPLGRHGLAGGEGHG